MLPEYHERVEQKRDASIDLRIGLNLLGAEGRALLVQYITTKRQRRNDQLHSRATAILNAPLQVSESRGRTHYGNQDH